MKSAVFLDIDNTIWDWDHYLPASVPAALRRLRANGHLAFFNSGRSRAHIQDAALTSLPLDGMAAACGNYIEADGKVLYEHCMSWEELQRVFTVAKRERMPFILEGSAYLWMNTEEFPGDEYVKRLWDSLKERARRLSDLKENDRVNKFSAAITDETDFARVKQDLGDMLEFLDHNGRVVEFIPKGSGKAQGIELICAHYGIDRANTYAIGDSVNDLDMLAYAGHGICMSNGTDVAKKAAEYVTASLREDGVLRALEHYGLI